MDATTVAVDLAKSVFEIAIADQQRHVVDRRRLNRKQFQAFLRTVGPTHVVMEACGTAHFWGRFAQAQGHRVSLLPPAYVRPYVHRNKTDRTDATALLEAVGSTAITPVPVKRVEQQVIVALHRVRTQWVTARTAHINLLRGVLREHGVLLPRGPHAALGAMPALLEDGDAPLPLPLRLTLAAVYEETRALEQRIAGVEQQLRAVAAADPVIAQLQTIPGVGLLTATALVGSVGTIHAFRRARAFASWVGLTPREDSSGLRRRLGRITKRGDTYLRCLLTHGARAVLLAAHRRRRGGQALTRLHVWALAVDARRGHNKATIAVANKLARIVWAVWHRDVPCALPTAA